MKRSEIIKDLELMFSISERILADGYNEHLIDDRNLVENRLRVLVGAPILARQSR